MNIPHRILTPDDPDKVFTKPLESDSSSEFVTPQSSFADVSLTVERELIMCNSWFT